MTASLNCTHISKSLGGRIVLDDLSISVRAGEVVSLLGASGSGKTTLLRVISGLADPDDGEITLDGRIVWGKGAAIPVERRGIGMVFQDYALWPHMSVARNLAFGLEAQRLPGPEVAARIEHALEVTRLGSYRDRYPSELSGGQQQRVAIARSLAMRPDLMLFDEVTAALDPETVKEVLVTIRELAQEGMTCILVTHEMGFAREIADHVYFTDHGIIVEHGPPAELLDNPREERTRAFLEQVL